MKIQSWSKGNYTCTTDRETLQIDTIHEYLSERSYWAKDRSREQVKKSIKHSLCFGVYQDQDQVGFARVLSDYTVYAYIMDVFILEEYRGKGLGKFLMKCISSHDSLQGLRKWTLGTDDAHGLYRQFGFKPLEKPQTFMERDGRVPLP